MAQIDLAAAKVLRRESQMGPSPVKLAYDEDLVGLLTDELKPARLADVWASEGYGLLTQQVAEKLLDLVSMLGAGVAHRLLRLAINAMCLYPALDSEPRICPKTLLAIRFVTSKQSEVALLGAIRAAQVMFLMHLAETSPAIAGHLPSWLARAHDC